MAYRPAAAAVAGRPTGSAAPKRSHTTWSVCRGNGGTPADKGEGEQSGWSAGESEGDACRGNGGTPAGETEGGGVGSSRGGLQGKVRGTPRGGMVSEGPGARGERVRGNEGNR